MITHIIGPLFITLRRVILMSFAPIIKVYCLESVGGAMNAILEMERQHVCSIVKTMKSTTMDLFSYLYPYASYDSGYLEIFVGFRNLYGFDPCPPGYERITNPCCGNGEGFICVGERPVPSHCFDY